MADPQTVDMSALFDKYTEDSHVDESQRFGTVPTHIYEATVDQLLIYKGTNEEITKTFDREYALCSFPAVNNGRKVGRVSFQFSWEDANRGPSGRPDRLYQAYNQIKGSLGMKGKPVGEILTTVKEQPLSYNVQEGYWDGSMDAGDLKWVPITDENRKSANEAGKKIVNQVNGIRAIKA